ncbi:hypothetical protein ACH47B_24830 [Rhodococcus sp. NPDC019627]|uniref:hypothetical protein n=1 Tax=unclassified Rhodococcus (in: high G+C Gram-positive bacteria) TaxID=192944 RepID=UPI0037AF8A05
MSSSSSAARSAPHLLGGSRCRICSGDIARNRAAASSTGTESPSVLRQIASTAAAFDSRERESRNGGNRTIGKQRHGIVLGNVRNERVRAGSGTARGTRS